jgi:hypothetical protein
MEQVTGSPSDKHNAIREGIRLGLVVATSIWIWIATVDALAGEPFRTFQVLGGIAWFTVMHYVLNVGYGTVIVAGLHSVMRQPNLIGGIAMGFLIIQFAFAMGAVLLSHLGLGELAWLRVFGGSLLGAAVAFVILLRRHPLATVLRQAGMEETDA